MSGGAGYAQTPLLTLLPEPATFELGRAVASAGDLDGDGTPDVLLGEPEAHGPFGQSGRIRVFSGASAVVLLLVNGDAADDDFGHSVAGGVDADGDAVPDVLVGAPFHDATGLNSGRAKLVSGGNGAILQVWDGASAYDMLGWAVAWG
ncbi:MAG: integrin alpha, partial [Planctomycetota bacterium]